ncbi:hypothetical protein [Bacillus sp. OTU530]|uniref:hypothetical protein n=1 Tax=Bacillus sp. OTU530 TaxID=3043862 RepID=UPI00313D30B6
MMWKRKEYAEAESSNHLYSSQHLFDLWSDTEEDEELDAVHQHLLRHRAFNSADHPDYLDISELFVDEDEVYGPYNEQGIQRRIDQYFRNRKERV